MLLLGLLRRYVFLLFWEKFDYFTLAVAAAATEAVRSC